MEELFSSDPRWYDEKEDVPDNDPRWKMLSDYVEQAEADHENMVKEKRNDNEKFLDKAEAKQGSG